MKRICLTILLVAASWTLQAQWSFTATLSVSGNCHGASYPRITIPTSGIPTKSQCESFRNQILAIRYSYDGCTVSYRCTPCTGSDVVTTSPTSPTTPGNGSTTGAESGGAFVTTNPSTTIPDWMNDYQQRMEAMRLTNLIFPRTGNNEFDRMYDTQQHRYITRNTGSPLVFSNNRPVKAEDYSLDKKHGRAETGGGFTMRPPSQGGNVLGKGQMGQNINVPYDQITSYQGGTLSRFVWRDAPTLEKFDEYYKELSKIVVDEKAVKGLAKQLKRKAEQSLKQQAVNNSTTLVTAYRNDFVEEIDKMEAEGIRTNNKALIEEAKTSKESLKKHDDAQKRIKDDEEARKKDPNLPPCDDCLAEAAEALLELMPKVKKILKLE